MPHAKISGPQGGVKHLLFGCERPKNECFTLPTVGKEHALGAFTTWASRRWTLRLCCGVLRQRVCMCGAARLSLTLSLGTPGNAPTLPCPPPPPRSGYKTSIHTGTHGKAKSTVMVERNPAFRQKAPGIRGDVWGEAPRFFYFFIFFL